MGFSTSATQGLNNQNNPFMPMMGGMRGLMPSSGNMGKSAPMTGPGGINPMQGLFGQMSASPMMGGMGGGFPFPSSGGFPGQMGGGYGAPMGMGGGMGQMGGGRGGFMSILPYLMGSIAQAKPQDAAGQLGNMIGAMMSGQPFNPAMFQMGQQQQQRL